MKSDLENFSGSGWMMKKIMEELIEKNEIALGQIEFEELEKALTETLQNFDEIMNDGLEGYKAAQKVFSGLTIEAYENLIKYQEKVAKNKELIDGVEGLNTAFLKLAKIAELDSASFEALRGDLEKFDEQAKSAYDKLIDAGFSGNDALEKIAPTLSKLKQLQEQFGLEVDDATQALIDEADAKGLLDNTTFEEKLILLLEKIANILGGTIPEAMDKMGDSARKNFDAMAKDADKFIENMGGKNIDMPGLSWTSNKSGSDMPGFAGGADNRKIYRDEIVKVHAGEILNVTPAGKANAANSGEVKVYFENHNDITINGGSGDVSAQVARAINDSNRDLMSALERRLTPIFKRKSGY
jgi:hypothetical protein